MTNIHILGICGTFMGSLAVLAQQQGYRVTGSDAAVYPPMSTQLEAHGISCRAGYAPLDVRPDLVIIGNALSRGNPAVEHILDQGIPYTSGPQWLAENILADRWVLAVAGTHGKTTASSMLAWILEYAGLAPGFLIGGIPENFEVSARLGNGRFFVVEADEYDTAFFDKRSKFVHYRPRTLVMNNLEFDHADIFPDLAAIQRQFHHLVRTVPSRGLLICNARQPALKQVLDQGCWTPVKFFSDFSGFSKDRENNEPVGSDNPPDDWQGKPLDADGSCFEVWNEGCLQGRVEWGLIGEYNLHNALAAIAAAEHAGVPAATACEALGQFRGVKRRMELRGAVNGISVYDDFAHHPTAIAASLKALRQRVAKQRIIAVLEPRSSTMRMGIHKDSLPAALALADSVLVYQPPDLNWHFPKTGITVFNSVENLLVHLLESAKTGDHVLIMSNGSFENIHNRLIDGLNIPDTAIN
ncbi:MAG: UDP-N-acetylmuramate:L-alanyl-gamma-D-glutamyl-meso-diaminopimelate ligase [Gammaproteobacteria bacterium]|nr:UDP-N-acetylmuramate:L-alanyl-gamma-D-glutamyl-meso-diaminopimelate ligase [Gammaproteobacteria bacterium]